MRLCDVNIFVYAHRKDAPHHAFHRAWLEAELGSPRTFLYSELVLSALVRIVIHLRIFKPASPSKRALEFFDQIRVASGGIGIMPGARHWEIFSRLIVRTGARGNLIPDAYLAALGIEAQAEWISTDRDFEAFGPDLTWTLLEP